MAMTTAESVTLRMLSAGRSSVSAPPTRPSRGRSEALPRRKPEMSTAGFQNWKPVGAYWMMAASGEGVGDGARGAGTGVAEGDAVAGAEGKANGETDTVDVTEGDEREAEAD